jgi:hybrid cluster-associated redox disulfide protein
MTEKYQLDLNISVAELVDMWPQVIPVFVRHRMACVGCNMASFETLRDAAKIYGIPAEVFLKELIEQLPPRV